MVFDAGELRVLPSDGGSYLAISHVWADGLGSTSEAGLPRCQVERLAALARSLVPESGAFWIDSLCVPRASDLRKTAIKAMGRTYKDAFAVLVLDQPEHPRDLRHHQFMGGEPLPDRDLGMDAAHLDATGGSLRAQAILRVLRRAD